MSKIAKAASFHEFSVINVIAKASCLEMLPTTLIDL